MNMRLESKMNLTVAWFSVLCILIIICAGMHQGQQRTGVAEDLKKNVKSIQKETVFELRVNEITNKESRRVGSDFATEITNKRFRRVGSDFATEITNKRSRRETSDSATVTSGNEKPRNNGQRTTTESSAIRIIDHKAINLENQKGYFPNQTDLSTGILDTNENLTDVTQFGSEATRSNLSSFLEGNITKDKNRRKTSGFNQGLMSKDIFNAIHVLVQKASLPLQIIAILLCFCSVVVYSMKSMKCSTSVYLISINVSEMLYSISALIIYIAGEIYGDKAMVSYYYLSIGLYLSNYVAVALRRSTFCTTSLVSAERMIVVAFPLKSKHFRLIRNPALIVALTVFASFTFHIFSALKYVVVAYQARTTNETSWKFAFTDLKDPIGKWSLSSKVIFVYTPLILTLLLNIGIVLAMRKHSQARRNLNINIVDKSESKEKQTTVVILASTFAFVFLALPTVTNSLVSNLATGYGPYTKEHYTFFSIMRLGEFCELLGSIINFLFYMNLSSKFRQSFLTLVPCIRRKMPNTGQTSKTIISLSTSMSSLETNSARPVVTQCRH